MHFWHQYHRDQHYTYGGRGHGRPGGESEGPPSGLRWLRPSGSDPGASTSLWPSPPELDLQREVRLSIFEKSNTAILRAVCDLEVWFFLALETFSAWPSEWEGSGSIVPFSLGQVWIVQPQYFSRLSCVSRFLWPWYTTSGPQVNLNPIFSSSGLHMGIFKLLYSNVFTFSFSFAFLWPWWVTRGPLGDLTPTVQLGLRRGASEVTDPSTDALVLFVSWPNFHTNWNLGCNSWPSFHFGVSCSKSLDLIML